MATAAITTINSRAQWEDTIRRCEELRAEAKSYEDTVWTPAYEREQEFERNRGLVPPGGGRDATPGYFETVKALKEVHHYEVPKPINDRMEALTDALCAAQSMLMAMPAPDLAALRWKLDHVLDLDHAEDSDGGSLSSWTGRYVAQMLADISNLMPRAA